MGIEKNFKKLKFKGKIKSFKIKKNQDFKEKKIIVLKGEKKVFKVNWGRGLG